MTSKRVTEAEVAKIRELAAEGKGPVTIARLIGRPYELIRRHAAASGITFAIRGRQGARQEAGGAPDEPPGQRGPRTQPMEPPLPARRAATLETELSPLRSLRQKG